MMTMVSQSLVFGVLVIISTIGVFRFFACLMMRSVRIFCPRRNGWACYDRVIVHKVIVWCGFV